MDDVELDLADRDMVPCGWCAAWLVPTVDWCSTCGRPGPQRRGIDVAETIGWLAIGIPGALVALGFGLGLVAERLPGIDGEDLGFLALLVAMAGFTLFLPGVGVAFVLGLGSHGRPARSSEAIVASWDVLASGRSVHAITLPAFRARPPDHAWVDGGRIPLAWREEDHGRSIARITTRDIDGDLRLWADGSDTALAVGVAVLGGAKGPGLRASLEIVDAIVVAVKVVDGRRAG